ncbi:glutamate receptor 2.7-like [Quercus robur]|uniref:glutamate receptor 2.7-like n=1 Tax=Quercus robur TaxID=38942 RepID=UPI0021631254|nr:glutamate receptor 2.7-like [Quercus robur]
MPIPFITVCTVSRPLFSPVLVYFLFILFLLPHGHHGAQANYYKNKEINIGVIIDVNSRIGKEEQAAMEIAAQNEAPKGRSVSLHFLDSDRDPQQVASAAENLIKEKKLIAIIGMHSWQKTALVADVGNRTQVPVLSFASPAITSPTIQLRWPLLIRMANDGSAQVKCIADIVCACNWRRVIVIYEEDAYGGDSGMSALLAEALQNIGVEIEYRLVLPSFSSVSNAEGLVQEELVKLENETLCRVFIVLQSSLTMVTNLFREAKKLRLVGGETESAWIIPDSITNMLDSVDKSIISSMNGTIGIKTQYSNHNKENVKFEKRFRANRSEEENSKPGIYALRAYDSIKIITRAIKSSSDVSSSLSKNILSDSFSGLSGEIRFEGKMLSQNPKFKIVKVDGEKSNELDIWTPDNNGGVKNKNTKEKAWPGLDKVPKGWAMPSKAKPMRIVVPAHAMFKEFVVDMNRNNSNGEIFGGFSIEIFHKVMEQMNYTDTLQYIFESKDGSYDDLVELVHNKTCDAVVGDITILSNRSKDVEFTQPYTESGLTMVVPVKSKESPWMFMKPFTWGVWLVVAFILIYTMFIVWFLEHPSNPEFKGSLKDQIATAMWFAFCSLFFAHRERIYNHLTRVVIAVWLFLVFVLTASYTANLSSMLTIKKMEPSVTSMELLKRNNLTVGYDKGTFVGKYLEEVHNFSSTNIKEIDSEEKYIKEFESKGIAAAFLEAPYAKVFLHKYCKGYITDTSHTATYRFGGFGFAFQKGSPFAREFSEGILRLSEKGDLKILENDLTPPNECSMNVSSDETRSLGLKSFWGLCLISFSTSTICFLLSLIHLIKNYQRYEETNRGSVTPSGSVWDKAARIAMYFYDKEMGLSRAQSSSELSLVIIQS